MTISRKLVLSFIGVACAPLVIGLTYVHKVVVQQTEAMMGSRLQDSTAQTAKVIDSVMMDAVRSMQDFTDDAKALSDTPSQLNERFRARTYTHPSFGSITLCDRSGQIIASSGRAPSTNLLSAIPTLRSEFKEALEDPKSRVFVADPFKIAGEKPASTVPLLFVVGVRDKSGKVTGAVIGEFLFGSVREQIVESLSDISGGMSSTLLDQNGHVLASTLKDARVLEPYPLTGTRFGKLLSSDSSGWALNDSRKDGRQMTGFASLRDYCADRSGSWHLLTSASYDKVMEPVNAAVSRVAKACLPFVLLIGVCGAFVARSLAKPIKQLISAASRLTDGDYSARVSHWPNDETGTLAQTFNHMAQQLEADRSSLRREMASRLKTEEERNRFYTLSLDLLVILDHNAIVQQVSPSFERVLGWAPEDIVGKCTDGFIHGVVVGEPCAGIEKLEDVGSLTNYENQFRCKSGELKWLSWNAVPGPDGLLYAAARDITEQKQVERELVEAKEQAEKANMAKNEFLSHMSHELRTPLNAVIGFAQLIQIQSEDHQAVESADSILKGGNHLLGLVNEILDLAKIEAGKLTVSVEPVLLVDVLRHSAELVRPLAEQRGIEFESDLETARDIYVQADRQRLVQVFLNLMTNATKYNKNNGKVSVRVLQGDGQVTIEVTDTGSGIRQSALHQLFQPFERLGDTSTDGTGLGLALSRRLMRLMGGELSLKESDQTGSTFSVHIDLAGSKLETGSSSLKRLQSVGSVSECQVRIVYIDDNFSNLHLVQRALANMGGVEILPAMQASLGVHLIEEHHPDLVLLDLHLPDASGLEVLHRLQANPRTADVPVVVISADATPKQIATLMEAGARAYLTKPIDLQSLFEEVRAVQREVSSRRSA